MHNTSINELAVCKKLAINVNKFSFSFSNLKKEKENLLTFMAIPTVHWAIQSVTFVDIPEL